MRRKSLFMTILVLAAMLLAACGGQSTSTSLPSTSVPPATVAETSTSEATSAPTEAATEAMTTTPNVPVTGGFNPSRVSNLIGSSVCGMGGNQLGTVQDLVLDFDQTMVTYVIVNGNGNTVAVPWNSISMTSSGTGAGATSAPTEAATSAPTEAATSAATEAATSAPTEAATVAPTTSSGTGAAGCLTLTVTDDMFNNAPAFDLSTLPAKGQPAPGWDTALQSYWQGGGTGAGATSAPTEAATSAATEAATSAPTEAATAAPTTTSGAGIGTSAQLQGVMLATDVLNATVMINGTGTGAGATSAPTEAATSAPTEAPTAAPGSSTGTGTASQGTIEDLIVESATGMMQYVVVQVGDTTNWTPVPINFLGWDSANNTFVLNVSSDVLQTAPTFSQDQFPDTSTSGWDQEFSTFWSSQSSSGSGTGNGTGLATDTPTP